MKRKTTLLIFLLLGVVLAGCAPMVTITNNTGVDIKVMIFASNGNQVFSPSPGNQSTAEVTEGSWTAAAVLSSDWINYARAKRDFLSSTLSSANSLTPAQISDLTRQLKDISEQIKRFETGAISTGSACSGKITEETYLGEIIVSQDASGKLITTCK